MSQDENSISMLEAGNLGSQEQAKEFACGFCNKAFVHEKRLMTHVKAKHSKEVAEEPKAAAKFSPLKHSTIDQEMAEDSSQQKGEPSKEERSGKRKRSTENSDGPVGAEVDEEEAADEELERHKREKAKRTKTLEQLEMKFQDGMNDSTLEEASKEAEDSNMVPNTQAMAEEVVKQIQEAENKMVALENDLNDTFEDDKDGHIANLRKQLDIKDSILNAKETQLIENQGRICELAGKVDKQARVINKKNLLIKEKEKEIKSIMRATNNITIKAGLSPSKEELKGRLVKQKRQIENLNGRIKNIQESKAPEDSKSSMTEGEKNQYEKMSKTVEQTVEELEAHKQKVQFYESEMRKLRRRIPCEIKDCDKNNKTCGFSHSLEYKSYIPPSDYKKKQLCRNFAGNGCKYSDEDCRYSHSLELLTTQREEEHGRDFTRSSYNEHNGSGSQWNNAFKRDVNNSRQSNYDSSIEILADFKPNDTRRTVRTFGAGKVKEELRSNAMNNNGGFKSNKYQGNYNGAQDTRSRQEPQEFYVQRPRGREQGRDCHPRDRSRSRRDERERGDLRQNLNRSREERERRARGRY